MKKNPTSPEPAGLTEELVARGLGAAAPKGPSFEELIDKRHRAMFPFPEEPTPERTFATPAPRPPADPWIAKYRPLYGAGSYTVNGATVLAIAKAEGHEIATKEEIAALSKLQEKWDTLMAGIIAHGHHAVQEEVLRQLNLTSDQVISGAMKEVLPREQIARNYSVARSILHRAQVRLTAETFEIWKGITSRFQVVTRRFVEKLDAAERAQCEQFGTEFKPSSTLCAAAFLGCEVLTRHMTTYDPKISNIRPSSPLWGVVKLLQPTK